MIIPEGFGQITHIFTGAGLPTGGAVVYGIEPVVVGNPTAIAEAAETAFTDAFGTFLTTGVTLTNTLCKIGPNATGAVGESGGTFVFSGTPPAASAAVCYLIQKRTALGGRANRGRMYLPSVAEANVGSDGTLTAGAVSTLQTAADAFLTDLDTASIPMVVLHTGVGAPTPVTELVVQTVVATQRNRQRR